MSGYTAFAKHYDALTANIDYTARARWFDELLRQYAVTEPKLLLDLACGTGSLSFAMQPLGYEVIGADASAEMLAVAMQKAYALTPDVRPVFLHQAMDKLDLYGTVDAAICALDSVNHIESERLLLAAFQKVALFLNPDGVFIFDANTLHKHREVLCDNAFVYDLPEVFCAWQNTYDARDSHVDISLDFFEKTGGGNYKRTSERFSEYFYSDEVLLRLLTEAGFAHIATLADAVLDSGGEGERLVFVARKISLG